MTETEFISIVQQLRRQALTVAHAFNLGSDDGDDVAQDALLKLWAIHPHLASADHAQRLAATIARNRCIDIRRRRHSVPLDSSAAAAQGHSPAPDDQLETAENDRWLQQKLQRLPSSQYQVLHLRQVERKSTEEIAALLGITPASVATLLSRARKAMLEAIRKKNR